MLQPPSRLQPVSVIQHGTVSAVRRASNVIVGANDLGVCPRTAKHGGEAHRSTLARRDPVDQDDDTGSLPGAETRGTVPVA